MSDETLVLECADCGAGFLAWSRNAKRCPEHRDNWRLWQHDDPIGAYIEQRHQRRYEANLRRLQRQREATS